MNKWYENGLRFECQGSGKCCSSHGEYGFVYLTEKDIQNMSEKLNLSKNNFLAKYCEYDSESDYYFLSQGAKSDCVFLDNKKCEVYSARPMQCRTWPFWPETMNYKVWKKEIESFCPGVNKGKLYSMSEIDKILKQQKEND